MMCRTHRIFERRQSLHKGLYLFFTGLLSESQRKEPKGSSRSDFWARCTLVSVPETINLGSNAMRAWIVAVTFHLSSMARVAL
jgi:hypothetical protein